MVREPIQNCESWIRPDFYKNSYEMVANKIVEILWLVNSFTYQNRNAVGVKLEDLKEYPKKTIPAICNWMGIKEEESLYQMTAQGKNGGETRLVQIIKRMG